MKYLNNFIVTT